MTRFTLSCSCAALIACALPLTAQTAVAPSAEAGLAPEAATFDAFDTAQPAFQPNAAESLDTTWPAEAIGASGDDRRTLGRFGANLGRNLAGVVARENLRPLLAGALVTGGGALLDGRTERFFARERRWSALGRVGQQLGEPRNLAFTAAAVFAAGRVSRDARFRAATYDGAQAFIVNGLWTGAIKFATRRERPDASSRLSFPSGHASNAFAWATVAERHYGPRVGVPAYALAGLIGVSRIEKNVHHLSDVLAGAALGYVVGRTVVREDGGTARASRRFTLAPTTGPDGRGVGLALTGSF